MSTRKEDECFCSQQHVIAPAEYPPLIHALITSPDAFPHPVQRPIRVIETQSSYVLLTGDFVYKVKKTVNLGFLDFHELWQRKEACDSEIRLNRRTAPDLYMGVVPITGTISNPTYV